ncbi:MAG: hydroxylamine reductase [Kineosporiaceae bacterium]|nr:hydroxylamine reductase [Kineosporiaceae bacterium]
MFCYQCEQTDRSGATPGCATLRGVCGKDETTADLQDLLVYAVKGIGQYATRARALGAPDDDAAAFALYAMFTTLTNVNFTATRFVELLGEAAQVRDRVKGRYEQAARAAGQVPEPLTGPAAWEPAADTDGLLAQAREHGITVGLPLVGSDVIGARALNLYGLKGVCAYAHHAAVLGSTSPQVFAGVEQSLDYLAGDPTDLEGLLAHALGLGTLNLSVMELLDAANTGSFGHPVPTAVRVTPTAGKALLVSGHDLRDLASILEATAGTGINVYTHGELLPAHSYPELKKYPHLVGNFGGAWQDQQEDFATFPGAIVMTSNCIIEPRMTYRQRIFTTGPVGWPGVRHLKDGDWAPAFKAAQALPGFAEDGADETIMVGFGRNTVLSVAGDVVGAVKSGAIKHFFLIGGCDGAVPGRNYYTKFAEATPEDSVVLTLGCAKYRFNRHDFGTVAGLPRLLDVGQCNDSYSAIKIAVALAEAFECGVNDLPLSLVISWFEQKAAAVLLTLLSLGITGIKLGPTLPAFLTPALVDVLVAKFGIAPIGEPAADLEAALAGAGS